MPANPKRGSSRAAATVPPPAPAALAADYRRHLVLTLARKRDSKRSQFTAAKVEFFINFLGKKGFNVESLNFPNLKALGVMVLHVQALDKSTGDAQTLLLRLVGDGGLRAVELNLPVRLLDTPTDPLFGAQWTWPKIDAPAAWRRMSETPAPNTAVIGIVDSGVKADHPDLRERTINGVRVIAPRSDAFDDDDGHGTLLAGTIGAVTGNQVGGAGTAGHCSVPVELLAVKFIDARTVPHAVAAAEAIAHAVNNGAQVINASWDIGVDDRLFLREAVRHADDNDVLIVAAAGNDGADNARYPTLPASYRFDNVISVMASDEHDAKPGFSNYGANVDIAAPGTRILSTQLYFRTLANEVKFYRPAYRAYSGTSAAAAHVTGAAALLKVLDADWTPAEIRDHLIASADLVPHLRGFCRANGRLNLGRAVRGPFRITSPRPRDALLRASRYEIKWSLDYRSPVVESVRIVLVDRSTGKRKVLASNAKPDRPCTVTLPDKACARATIRVECRERPLFDESGEFRVV